MGHHPEEGLQKDTTAASAVEATQPDPVTVTLAALGSSLRDGRLALAVGAGLQVVDALIDDLDRTAVRNDAEAGSWCSAARSGAPSSGGHDRWIGGGGRTGLRGVQLESTRRVTDGGAVASATLRPSGHTVDPAEDGAPSWFLRL
jgi:hypothetical protein